MTLVLVIDDSPEDRLKIENLLSRELDRFSVATEVDGLSGLEHLKHHPAECVLLDLQLEVEDGLEVMSLIKDYDPFCPVIILTGQGDESLAAKSIKSGASDYLVKSQMTSTHLETAIDNAISRAVLERRVADQDVERKAFLNTLVHDLRAPLRQVEQLGAIALEEYESGNIDGAKEVLSKQERTSRRASALVNALEAYSLLEQDIELAPLSLADIAEEARENLESEINRTGAVVSIDSLPSVNGNKPRLIQLFQNLVQNGLKYNESDTPKLTIRTEQASEGFVGVVIEDNGIGIESKNLDTIFSPLSRLWGPDKYEGTGLGLATCERILQRHSGKIWCTSTHGEGSEFHMTFPSFD